MNTTPVNECTVDYFKCDDAEGVERRLGAAVRSAENRGDIRVGFAEVSRDSAANSFGGNDRIVILNVSISSIEGEWSRRAYHIAGRAQVVFDAFSVTTITGEDAVAIVLNREHTAGTRFKGEGVNYALTRLVRQVIFRDIALKQLGLLTSEPPQPQSLADWEAELDVELEFTGQTEVSYRAPSAESAIELAPIVGPDEPLADWEAELLQARQQPQD